jgi:hypothetical protein
MGIVTILRFLIGQRQAILDIAASRSAIWLGLLFVLSAGFAREYDGEDLWHEPWHLLLPLAASLVTSTILFIIMWLALHGWRTLPNEWRTYQSFVTLYWMTAPLAWIYAIPVERMFPAAESTQANLWFLGIVAAWRVVLMIRVVTVIFQAPFSRVFFPFMLFADGVLLTLISIVPVPVLAVMGGVRLSASDRIMAEFTFLATVLGTLSLPLWGVGSLITLCVPSRGERVPSFTTLPEKTIQPSLWSLAAASLLVWIFVLPFTQPEQHRRWAVERLMKAREIDEALKLMSQWEEKDFPPHWDPPPRIAQLRGPHRFPPEVPMMVVMHELERVPSLAPWVRAVYEKKVEDQFEWYWPGSRFWQQLSDEDLNRYLDWFERHPPSAEFIEVQRSALRYADKEFQKRSPEQRQRLRAIFGIEEWESQQSGEKQATESATAEADATPPNSAELPQTSPADESKDAGIRAAPPAGREVDR